jgi:hypothetical protein
MSLNAIRWMEKRAANGTGDRGGFENVAKQARHDMYKQCKFKSYKDAAVWFSKARSPHTGRKYSSWGFVRNVNGTFVIDARGVPVCKITPDNMLTMMLSVHTGQQISQTLSSSLSRLVPISWTRVGLRRYRILSIGALDPGESWWEANKTAPELFNGLQLDLSTSKFVNAKPDMLQRVNGDARKVWLRSLKAFKRGIKTRAKIGVFDAIEAKLNTEKGRKFRNGRVEWTDEKYIALLHTSIRDQKYPKVLLGAILLTVPRATWNVIEPTMFQKIDRTIDFIVAALSVELRTRFGVFSDEVSDEKAN